MKTMKEILGTVVRILALVPLMLLMAILDFNTAKHSLMVANHLRKSAGMLGKSKTYGWILGLCHDIGKLDLLLTRNGSKALKHKGPGLPDEMWLLIKTHIDTKLAVWYGKYFEAIRYHHERLDGSGYLRLEGDEICEWAQLLAVSDSYIAGIMKRCYKGKKSRQELLEELRGIDKLKYNQKVVEVC